MSTPKTRTYQFPLPAGSLVDWVVNYFQTHQDVEVTNTTWMAANPDARWDPGSVASTMARVVRQGGPIRRVGHGRYAYNPAGDTPEWKTTPRTYPQDALDLSDVLDALVEPPKAPEPVPAPPEPVAAASGPQDAAGGLLVDDRPITLRYLTRAMENGRTLEENEDGTMVVVIPLAKVNSQ